MKDRDALAAAAMQLVGVPFRLHGRDPRLGLDCVGVLVAAFAAIGRVPRLPLHYRLRRANISDFLTGARELGLVDASGSLAPGDVLVVKPGPAQFHAAIVTQSKTIVHAHAGLGHVVASPAPLPWPVEHHWRLPDR